MGPGLNCVKRVYTIKESGLPKFAGGAWEMRIEREPGTSRRNLLRACVAGALLGRAAGEGKSKVVISRDALLRPSGAAADSSRLLNVLDRAIQSVYDADSPMGAWKRVARPGEVVGLKVNCLAGRALRPVR